MQASTQFSLPDYLVFSASLLFSFVIGVYSSFRGKKEKTAEDFYFGNHDMNIVAVAMSLAATFLSAIGLLGVPSEIYSNGISWTILLIAETICAFIAIFLLIPFFYNLRLISVYEYFEHRFNKTIRKFACLLFITNMLLYMAIVLYAPALALSHVSGLPIWVSISTSGFICTVYTSLGGMEAVIWTDAFQMTIMLAGLLIVFIHGIISAGGVTSIVEANQETGRLHITFDPDPTIRHSFWAVLIGGFFNILPFSMNQATIQRYLSVKNKRSAQRMLAIQLPTILFWWLMLAAVGATMFAYYRGCDPQMAGRIERPDQMMAIYVGDILGYLKGLPGLFTAVVYSATLSSVSSGVNSIVVVLTEDFLKPLYAARTKSSLSERSIMRITKGLSFLVGFTAVGLAFVASSLGQGLIQFCLSLDGMCGGPLLGLFFCGMVLPYCSSKGAAVGLISGLLITFWLGAGSILIKSPQTPLPLSIDNCSFDGIPSNVSLALSSNNTILLPEFPTNSSVLLQAVTAEATRLVGINVVYGISYQYYSVIGFTVTVSIATIVSFLTGRQDSSKIPHRFFLFKLFSEKAKLVEDEDEFIMMKNPKHNRLTSVDRGIYGDLTAKSSSERLLSKSTSGKKY